MITALQNLHITHVIYRTTFFSNNYMGIKYKFGRHEVHFSLKTDNMNKATM
jgi:hypothetical protein